MTRSSSFWLQISEPITHMDTDNCTTHHHKGTSYFDSITVNDNLSFLLNE